MRVVHAAALAVAALLVASVASAQGLGDAAAREREKRKASQTKPAKVYTEDDIGQSMAPVSSTSNLPSDADETQPAAAGEAAEGGAAPAGQTDAEKAAQEQAQQAQQAWQKRLDQARKEEAVYKDVIDKLQLELNDTSGGFYNPSRTAKMNFLEENKQKLAEVQGRIAAIEEEGRRNGYR
jgi:hypothetical protein